MADETYPEGASHAGTVAWIVGAVSVAAAVAFAPLADASQGYLFLAGPIVAALAVGVALRARFRTPLRTLVSLAVLSALVELFAAVAIVVVVLLLFGV
jgi:hypothetical protein